MKIILKLAAMAHYDLNMVKVIEKKERDPIVTQIVFTATEKQKQAIDKIKAERPGWDVNAMFREYAEALIAQANADVDLAG